MAYTNSPLVTYTNITNHKTSPRKKPIDTITIHCIVGQWTAKQGCDYFATTDRECSANYVVGKDGSIGLSVDEKDRSWCSSSSANDNRAITIEVASDTKAPYAVTDAAYNALIQLVADICKRNNIKKLVWSTEKDDRVNHKNGCNMTVHRDYANKSCPGEYLYERHGDIAAKVNAILATSVAPVEPADNGEMTDEEMFKFFKSHGMTDAGVAGLMGNLFAESALKSTNLQNTFEKKLGMTDAAYTEAVDSGSYDNFVKDSAGYGLAQWTYWSRKQALLEFMKKNGVSIGHKKKQCEFLIQEIKGYKNTWKVLTSTTSVQEASDVVLTEYERPANQSDAVKAKRASYGKTYFDKYGEKVEADTGVMYRVQVGAFTKKENADAQLKKVSAAGFDTYMVQIDGYYKIQVGAYSKKSNADAMLEKVQAAGFNAFITTKGGQAVATVAPVVKKEIKVGSVVKLNKGAKTYTGGSLASFVYDRNHVVKQINVDRVVITYNNVVVAAVKKSDLTLVE